jgi:hypothetical protein
MRIFVAFLIVLAALYYWDVNYNHGMLSDGVIAWNDRCFTTRGISLAAGDGERPLEDSMSIIPKLVTLGLAAALSSPIRQHQIDDSIFDSSASISFSS